ncbi:hypothetical protein BDY17DRAFT_202835 [Neohortaea acidophila]|uniref:Uncharacterized protein n=1 Tax=Neohortaea acidophila TaxID=245834 RepID=A0A6A6PLH5_9PEZI|nr:uncharacterized protein BDY17DRAFT_202835 [Neohortaea acidophila]KAF2480938.1 hypothetical protein BDY17DRAFT_202835 [Neohortaea acidophila]
MPASDNPAVPKFGSFKGRERKRVRDESGDTDKHSRPRPSHKDQDTARVRHTRTDKHGGKSAEVGSRKPSRSQSPGRPTDSALFVVDVRGDSKIIQFGGLHRYDIPSYHRVGAGSVIGASPSVKIDRDGLTEKDVAFRRTNAHHRTNLTTLERRDESHRPGFEDARSASASYVGDGESQQDYLSFRRRRSSSARPEGQGIWALIEEPTLLEEGDSSH